MEFTPEVPNSPAYRAAEQAVGDVPGFLTNQRSTGASYAEISILLRMYGATVSYETVRSWCARLQIGASA
jgi:hypothetical protein